MAVPIRASSGDAVIGGGVDEEGSPAEGLGTPASDELDVPSSGDLPGATDTGLEWGQSFLNPLAPN